MKNLFKSVSALALSVFLYPSLALAANSTCDTGTLGGLICKFSELLNSIVPLLLALGVVYFTWGVVRYVIADGEEAKDKGRDIIIYGIIGFAVIIGLWGLVNIVVNTFNLSAAAPQATIDTCQGLTNGSKLQDLFSYVTCIIDNAIIPAIFALAGVMFVWGVVNFFIIGAEEEAKREQGRQFIIWGVIALTVMIAFWGLVKIVGSTFNLNTSVIPHVTPPGSGSSSPTGGGGGPTGGGGGGGAGGGGGGGSASCGISFGSCPTGQVCLPSGLHYACEEI